MKTTPTVQYYWIDPAAERNGIKFIVRLIEDCVIKRQSEVLDREVLDALAAVNHDARDPILEGYRSLFTELGITGAVASPELLLQLFCKNNRLPKINTGVDPYNLVSLARKVVISAHDLARLRGPVRLMMAEGGEIFYPLGGRQEELVRGEWYVRDDEHLLCRLNCKQSELSKITLDTHAMLIYIQGNRMTTNEYLETAMDETCEAITRHCGGTTRSIPKLERNVVGL